MERGKIPPFNLYMNTINYYRQTTRSEYTVFEYVGSYKDPRTFSNKG